MGKLQNYTIMPLDTAHLDEICEDIRAQVENGVMTLDCACNTLDPVVLFLY